MVDKRPVAGVSIFVVMGFDDDDRWPIAWRVTQPDAEALCAQLRACELEVRQSLSTWLVDNPRPYDTTSYQTWYAAARSTLSTACTTTATPDRMLAHQLDDGGWKGHLERALCAYDWTEVSDAPELTDQTAGWGWRVVQRAAEAPSA